MQNIQSNLVSLRKELQYVPPNNNGEFSLIVKSTCNSRVVNVSDTIADMRKINCQGKEDERPLDQRSHSKGVESLPMTFVELKLLPTLEPRKNGLVVWHSPFRCDKRLEFPPTVKQRKTLDLVLPKNKNFALRRQTTKKNDTGVDHAPI